MCIYRFNEQKEQLAVFQSNWLKVLHSLTLLVLLLRAEFAASGQLEFVTTK